MKRVRWIVVTVTVMLCEEEEEEGRIRLFGPPACGSRRIGGVAAASAYRCDQQGSIKLYRWLLTLLRSLWPRGDAERTLKSEDRERCGAGGCGKVAP